MLLQYRKVANRIFTGSVTAYSRYSSSSKIEGLSPILDELKDLSSLAKPSDERKILVLDHNAIRRNQLQKLNGKYKFKNKELKRLPSTVLLQEDAKVDKVADYIDGINAVRNQIPYKTVSHRTREELIAALKNGFKRKQLFEYLKSVNLSPTSKDTKNLMAQRIVDRAWKIKTSNRAIDVMDALLHTQSFKITHSDIFLILSKNAFMIRHLQKTGAKVTLEEDSIQFQGTTSQIQLAQLIFNVMLSKSVKEDVDFTALEQLFQEKYGFMDTEKVSATADVFFEKTNMIGHYSLRSLSQSQIERAKRLMLWLLDYNKHIDESLVVSLQGSDDSNIEIDPFEDEGPIFVNLNDDSSLPWYIKGQKLYRLRDFNTHIEMNHFVKQGLMDYSNEALNQPYTLEDLNKVKHLCKRPDDAKRQNETWDLIHSLGLKPEDFSIDDIAKEDSLQNGNSMAQALSETIDKIKDGSKIVHDSELQPKFATDLDHKSPANKSLVLSDNLKQVIYNKVAPHSSYYSIDGPVNEYPGVPRKAINPPIFTTTIGNILFENKQLNSKYHFNTNVPFVSDISLNEGFFNNELGELSKEDPNFYSVQIRFMPELFQDKANANYPPVELFMDIDPVSGAPELETLSLVTVEAEKNCYISLPRNPVDMKVTSQVTGNLIEEIDPKITNDQVPSEDYASILNEPSQHLKKFTSQPGLVEFFQEAKLVFNKKTFIPPMINIQINGKTVKYKYAYMSHRQTVEMEIGGELAQLNIVEGGHLGGRKLEINFIGDLQQSANKEVLANLIDNTCKFIAKL